MIEHLRTYRKYILLAAIVAAAFLIYSSSINFEFTNWDDDIHITNNPAIQQFSLPSVISLLSASDRYMYHPLTMLTYMIEWNIAGEQPWLFHTTNVVLHLINICLVFFLIVRISKNHILALCTAALFALHPLQVESVAWISARKDLLSGFFMLLSALSYFRWKEKSGYRRYVVSVIFFLLAILSKPSAVVLPLLLVLCNLFEDRKISTALFIDTIPYFILSAIATVFVMGTTVSHSPLPFQYYSLPQKVVLIMYQFSFYIFSFIVPARLSACYSYPQLIDGVLPFIYYLGAGATMLTVFLLVFFRTSLRPVIIGFLVYCCVLLPVVQIIPFNNASLVADRYTYFAIIGLALAFIPLVEVLSSNIGMKKWQEYGFSFIVVGIFCFVTIIRLPVWNDSITLFTDVLQKNPDSAIAYGNRANAKIAKGYFTGAVEDCNALTKLFPEEPKAFYNRGNAYSEMKQHRQAISDYSTAIAFGFSSPNVFYNRGNQYMELKKYDSASADYDTVLHSAPAYLGALFQLHTISITWKNDYAKSLFYLTEYIKYNPNDASVYLQRSQTYVKLGQFGAALHDAAVSLSLNPHYDTSGTFVHDVNHSIDSINVSIAAISADLQSQNGISRKLLLEKRSKLYWSLGDTLRAGKDQALSGLVTGR